MSEGRFLSKGPVGGRLNKKGWRPLLYRELFSIFKVCWNKPRIVFCVNWCSRKKFAELRKWRTYYFYHTLFKRREADLVLPKRMLLSIQLSISVFLESAEVHLLFSLITTVAVPQFYFQQLIQQKPSVSANNAFTVSQTAFKHSPWSPCKQQRIFSTDRFCRFLQLYRAFFVDRS